MPEIFVAIKRILWPVCGNEICATTVQNFNKARGLSNPPIFWARGQRARISQDVLAFRILQDRIWLLSWQGGLCSYMWVGSTIRRGSYRLQALLSHYFSLWHLIFTVLASVENGELYLGSQCAQWPYGNGTQRDPVSPSAGRCLDLPKRN